MKPIEKDLMIGMISILNQAIESKNRGTPIMEDKYIDIRLADLKEFENETDVMFVNSPNCEINMESIIKIREINNDNLKECKDVSEIIEYSNQKKEIVVYLDIVGADMIITYIDGLLINIQTNDINIKKAIKSLNLPYKIKKDGVYTVKGKTVFTNKPIFYVNDVLKGGSGNLRDDLNEAEKLDFDIAPFWSTNNLNPKKLKGTIDYVIDYAADDDLDCNGVVFKFSEKKFSNILNFVGYYYNNDNNK